MHKWSLECLLRRLLQVLVLLTQNLLQHLNSCAGACMSLYCCQQCKSLLPSLPRRSVQTAKGLGLGLLFAWAQTLWSFLTVPLDNFVRSQQGRLSSGKAWRVV